MKWRRGWLRGLAAVQTGVPPGGRCQSSERERAGWQQSLHGQALHAAQKAWGPSAAGSVGGHL